MNYTRKAYFYAGVAVLCWSTVAAAFKKTLSYLYDDVLNMLFYSTLVSVIALFLILVFQGKFINLYRIKSKEILSSLILGLLNPFLYYTVLFKAYSLLPGQEAQPLNYTWPIVLTILSIPLLGQKIRFVHVMAIVISFCGVLVTSTHGRVFSFHFTSLPGALLAVGSSVLWALYWIFNMRDNRDSVLKLFVNFCFGLFYISFAAISSGRIGLPSWQGLIGVAWIGLFEMGLAFVFWLKALEYAEKTTIVSNLVYLSPFVSLFFLRFVVGERILLSSVIGLCLIILGILIQVYKTKD